MPRKKIDPAPLTAPDSEPAAAKGRSRRPAESPPAQPRARKAPAKPAAPAASPPPAPEAAAEAPAVGPRVRRLFKKSVPEPQPVVAAEPDPSPAKTAEPSRVAPVKRARSRKAEPVAAPEDDLPVPSWRPRQTTAPPAGSAVVEAEPSEDEGLAPRRSRRRRRRDAEDLPEAQPAPRQESADRPAARRAGAARPAPIEPVIQTRPQIPIPPDAPQVVLRDGVPTIVRAGRVYPPLMFFGSSPDERRAKTVLDEVRMAGEAGIQIHSHLLEFEVDLDAVDASVALAAYLLAQTLKEDAEAQVLFRLVFQAPRGWQSRYTRAKYQTEDGQLAEPSVCDDEFWEVATECLARFIRKLRLLESRDHILGVHLERGEWFMAAGWGYDNSEAASIKFRDWAKTRYLGEEVMLRASWFDGSVRFDTVAIPPFEPEGTEGDRFVRSSRKQRRYVDYHLFLSDATVARIGDLAYAAKEASEGRFLVGVSYGYTFEWSHPSSGHLSLGKLLRTREIDFVAGPPSYRTREPGGAAPFPCPIDSLALNGKLYISEEDYKTSIGDRHEPDDFNPVIKTPQALESVHWRGAGVALAHSAGMCWMDLWGNGWLKTPSIWERARRILDSLVNRMACPVADPDVVVFIDERALAYLVDQNAFTLLVQNVRESVLRSGMSAGFFLLSDLQHREKFPEAKLYVFLNAWDIRPELRAAIKTRLQRDNKVLFWLYAAGLFDSGRESLERAREVTGIALKPQPFHSRLGTTILNRRHPLCEAFPDRGVSGATKLEPSYFAIPEEAMVLGEYTQTGLPSFVVKDFAADGDRQQAWTSVFLGEPVVSPGLIRALGQMAGAHIWNYQEDVVHVRSPFLTVHCNGAGPRTITLPDKWSAYSLQAGQWVATDSTNLRFSAVDGSTHVFLVGIKEELEHMLATSPETLLRMDELPERPNEDAHFDGASFDVPIMKLEDWIEAGVDDDVADEWFLRPKFIEQEDEPELAEDAAERGGRRRRRRGRRGGTDRAGAEEIVTARAEPSGDPEIDDLGMSVVFRKRE